MIQAGFEKDIDPVLQLLDRNIQAAIEARSEYLAARSRQERELMRLNEQARGSFGKSTLNVEQVAERFLVEPSTIRDGAGRHSCLRKAGYKPGKRLLFPIRVIELHERNLIQRGQCGECFQKAKKLEVLK
jgi:hypothetical protein